MSAWPDYEGKVINVEFRVSDDQQAKEWLFKQLDKIVELSSSIGLPDSPPMGPYRDEFVTGWGDLAEVRT